MSSPKSYRIEESEARGKIVIAVRDIKPGELVVEETEPALFFPNSFYAQYDTQNTGLDMALPAFSVYMKQLTPEKQRRFLTLFGPTTGISAEIIRNFARENFKFRFKEDEELRRLTPEELELFVKVAQVARLNIFGSESAGYAVFEEITRFAHSCDANCTYAYEGKSISCRANRCVKAGEELTLSYVSGRDIHATHERRYKYLEVKEFTCHCARCDALGDDTRQFDCVDPRCKGVMMVCEPIDRREIPITNAKYLGVEYAEPHLLPCTVCHRAAPAKYQQEMFELEASLPGLIQQYNTLHSLKTPHELEQLLRDLLSQKIPRRHAASLPLMDIEWRVKQALFLSGLSSAASVQTSLEEYIAAMENILKFPHSERLKALNNTVGLISNARLPSFLSPKQEKDLCAKALRMHLLLKGRNKRDEIVDDAVCRVLQKLPPVVSTEVCSFCEESPQRAALTLSRCGRCRRGVPEGPLEVAQEDLQGVGCAFEGFAEG